jgi:hypothetical protein
MRMLSRTVVRSYGVGIVVEVLGWVRRVSSKRSDPFDGHCPAAAGGVVDVDAV